MAALARLMQAGWDTGCGSHRHRHSQSGLPRVKAVTSVLFATPTSAKAVRWDEAELILRREESRSVSRTLDACVSACRARSRFMSHLSRQKGSTSRRANRSARAASSTQVARDAANAESDTDRMMTSAPWPAHPSSSCFRPYPSSQPSILKPLHPIKKFSKNLRSLIFLDPAGLSTKGGRLLHCPTNAETSRCYA
jgi:hypothetical protein